MMQELNMFSSVLGQQIGPLKSNIWFSRRIAQGQIEDVASIFMVPLSQQSDRYLGPNDALAYEFLIDKFVGKLQSWKARADQGGASIASRLLHGYIKSSRSDSQNPDLLHSQVFLGQTGKRPFLGIWDMGKITRPFLMGGLGVRALDKVNEALLLKSLWRLAANANSLWVNVARAKYIPK